jgi:hypothetical protein
MWLWEEAVPVPLMSAPFQEQMRRWGRCSRSSTVLRKMQDAAAGRKPLGLQAKCVSCQRRHSRRLKPVCTNAMNGVSSLRPDSPSAFAQAGERPCFVRQLHLVERVGGHNE